MSNDEENNTVLPNSNEIHASDFKKKLNFLQNADLFKINNRPEEKETNLIEDVERIHKLRQPPYHSDDEENAKKGLKKKEKDKKEKKKASIRNPFKRSNTSVATERPTLDTTTVHTPLTKDPNDKIKLVTSPAKLRPKREKLHKVNPHKIREQLALSKSTEELFKPNEEAKKELEKLQKQEQPDLGQKDIPAESIASKKPPIGGVAMFGDPARMLTVLKRQKSKLQPIEKKDSLERSDETVEQEAKGINDLNNNGIPQPSARDPDQGQIKILSNMNALKSRPRRTKFHEAVVEMKKHETPRDDLFDAPKHLGMHNETEEEVNAHNAMTNKTDAQPEPKGIKIRPDADAAATSNIDPPNRVSMVPSYALRNPMLMNSNFLSELKSKQTLSMYAKIQDDPGKDLEGGDKASQPDKTSRESTR